MKVSNENAYPFSYPLRDRVMSETVNFSFYYSTNDYETNKQISHRPQCISTSN